jgi:hypothetical protein
MSGDIDFGTGPKPEEIQAMMQEIKRWKGSIIPKPNFIVIINVTYTLLIYFYLYLKGEV